MLRSMIYNKDCGRSYYYPFLPISSWVEQMDSKKRLQNAFEDILANTFDSNDYMEVYAVSDAGLLLNDVPGEVMGRKPTLLANLMSAADAVADDPLVVLTIDEGRLFLKRINNTSFLVVKTVAGVDEKDVNERIEESARRIKIEIPWLR